MKPKEKARELINRFRRSTNNDYDGVWTNCCDGGQVLIDEKAAKQCALIAVDELIEESHGMFQGSRYDYWKEVKKELEP